LPTYLTLITFVILKIPTYTFIVGIDEILRIMSTK